MTAFDTAEYRSIHPAYLVRINDSLILNVSEIIKAERCGCYTNVYIRSRFTESDSEIKQIWDEDKSLWNRLCAAGAP